MVERGVKLEQQGGADGELFLPPGFRFHPTDDEVITSYLLQKLLNPSGFSPRAMGEVNLNKCEPWDLPSKAKMGEKEWYFFCHKDMKYPTGMRANRATEKGYWKATGKDREIFKPSSSSGRGELVGMKKTLVFYMGRAPRGSKTNWVMHEFRLEGKYGRDGNSNANLRLRPKDEWVVCKVFHKNNNGEAADDKKAGAAAAEYSSAVGTPNVSSISVEATADVGGVDDDDGFINSMIEDPAYFNSTTNLPDFSTTMTAAAADYSSIPCTAAATGGFVNVPNYTFPDTTTTSRNNNLNMQAGAAVANSTAAPPPNPTASSSSSYDVSSLFSWNLPHAGLQNPMGSSFNLHDQLAMMTRALGGGGGGGVSPPNFAAGLPTTAGIPQHNSPLLGHGGYAPNYYYSGSRSAAGPGTGTGESAKNLGA